jgi:nucleoside-diphosphate kinase
MVSEEMLVFLKPDAVIRRGTGARVLQEFLNNIENQIVYFGEIYPFRDFIATKHYVLHKGRFFYEWLVEYVTSSPLLVFILKGENIINKVRTLLGPTIPGQNDTNTIRGKYGIFGGINVAHASDSSVNGYKEVEMWRSLINIKDCNYGKKASEYIRRYIDFPIIDAKIYREISNSLVEEKITQKEAKEIFMSLLLRESDFDKKTISQFAIVIIRNALLRKKEVMKNDNFCQKSIRAKQEI